jgi:hypothetical protein
MGTRLSSLGTRGYAILAILPIQFKHLHTSITIWHQWLLSSRKGIEEVEIGVTWSDLVAGHLDTLRSYAFRYSFDSSIQILTKPL